MIYKLGYNLSKAEINKRVMAYEANQTEIASLKAKLEEATVALRRLSDWPEGWGYDGDMGTEMYAYKALEAIEGRDGE